MTCPLVRAHTAPLEAPATPAAVPCHSSPEAPSCPNSSATQMSRPVLLRSAAFVGQAQCRGTSRRGQAAQGERQGPYPTHLEFDESREIGHADEIHDGYGGLIAPCHPRTPNRESGSPRIVARIFATPFRTPRETHAFAARKLDEVQDCPRSRSAFSPGCRSRSEIRVCAEFLPSPSGRAQSCESKDSYDWDLLRLPGLTIDLAIASRSAGAVSSGGRAAAAGAR